MRSLCLVLALAGCEKAAPSDGLPPATVSAAPDISSKSPVVSELPAASAAADPTCLRRCIERNQMRAEAAEKIAADCRTSCGK